MYYTNYMRMKYSLVNGERSEPQPGLSGQCPVCGSPTIPKCGDVRVQHWAHKGKRVCDPWWENETEWHRSWKGQFPEEWQEIIQYAESDEKHIADVKTAHGWVIEFQHSYLQPEERRLRTTFYGPLLCWVIDKTGSVLDKKRFYRALDEFNPFSTNSLVRELYLNGQAFKVSLESSPLDAWAGLDVPVLFDFGEYILPCLLPITQNHLGYVVAVKRSEFVALHNKDANQIDSFQERLIKLRKLIVPTSVQAFSPKEERGIPQASDPMRSRPRVLSRRGPLINTITQYTK
jgi:hypothetical protein